MFRNLNAKVFNSFRFDYVDLNGFVLNSFHFHFQS